MWEEINHKLEYKHMQVIANQYRLHELLLSLSHGEVFVCYDLINFATRNLWIMPPARKLYAASFVSVCNIVQNFSRKEFPKIYASGIDPTSGKIYVVFEHFQATNLQHMIQNDQKVSYQESVNIFLQLLRAVKYAENYVPHGRINPRNILVKDKEIQLLGFGLGYLQKVSDLDEEMKTYLSPEQLIGKKGDSLSDLYSIGMIFFRLLFGYATASHSGLVAKIEEFSPTSEPLSYSHHWRLIKDIILRLLSESPSDRHIPNDSDSYEWFSAVEI